MSHPISSSSPWQRVALLLTLLLATFLNFYNLAIEGYANLYYAAGVYSMGLNWHAFFFNSFDPAGFVTIDKPPLGLWLQVFSSKVFGFTGWALILPQALAGVLAVALVYYLVRRIFGANAGLLAALILAITPINVAANRNNTMDSVLLLTLLLAAWAVTLAAERGQLRWLLLCGLLVGLGFEIKMLQAYMVLPAFYLVYFFTAQTTWRRRVWHLTLTTLVIAAVSLAWPLAVDFTPAKDRPYVGSSDNNTMMELIVGHNGAARLGQMAGLVGLQVGDAPGSRAAAPQDDSLPRGIQPPALPPENHPNPNQPGQAQQPQGNNIQPNGNLPTGNVPGNAILIETGEIGPLRLFNRQLAGQISWFLPLALLFCLFIPLAPRLLPAFQLPANEIPQNFIPRSPNDLSTASPLIRFTLLWAVWLIPQVIFFSYAGLFHRYYLTMMAPAIAALVGAGFKLVFDAYHTGGWGQGWLLAAVMVVAVTQVGIVSAFPEFAMWLIPLALMLAAILLVFGFLLRHRQRWVAGIVTLLVVPLFLAPLTWSLIPVIYGGHTGLPYAGPELLESANVTWAAGSNMTEASALANYLLENQGQSIYLAAAQSAQHAAPLILLTGQPVMALGGFNGGDHILSVEDFAGLVAEGQVRFVLAQDGPQANQPPGAPAVPGNHRQPQNLSPNAPNQSQIIQWAVQNCTPVDGFPVFDCAVRP